MLSGEAAIKEITRFPVDRYYAGMASCIDDLEKSSERSMVYELIDRVLINAGTIPPDTFLITASTKAGIDRIVESQGTSARDCTDCFPPFIGDYICRRLSLEGDSLHISAACASSTVALAKGAALIESGRYDSVLICCYDLVTEFIFSGFCSLQAMSPFPCKPFDKNRKGMSIGEGAAALLLMSEEKAGSLHKTPMGVLKGWGVTNDATHITRPDKEGSGLAMAIDKSLKKSGITAHDVSAICAHGTGTYHNDLMELASYRKIFGRNCIPIFSVKGAIGHTLGAAGGIEAAISLASLDREIIPPTTGFSDPEPGAEGALSSEPINKELSYILSTNSGFNGINASIIIGNGVC